MAGAIKLGDVDFFGQISTSKLHLTKSAKVCKDLSRGEVFSEPDECRHKVYIVEDGQVRLYQLSADGREQTLDILSTGAIFGDLTPGSQEEPLCVFAAAEKEGTCVCIIDKKQFFALIATKPKLALEIIVDLARRLSYAQEKIAELSLADAKVRLLSELVRLSRSFGMEDGEVIRFKRRFTHEQLATLIGTTRETVTKTIKAINDDCQGCVTMDKNHYFVLDKNKVLEVIAPL
ncbi:Crp/Fnr family transcriptional regulator [Candidatus Curtissbacteria bacterium]|nr:Crp/Fnr family transcriptional regulator [Candidatus Curtissbacteria bacterium]